MAEAFDGVETKNTQPSRSSFCESLSGALLRGWFYFSFSHMGGLLDKGREGQLDADSAIPFHPDGFDAQALQKKFETIYYSKPNASGTMHIVKSLLKLERRNILLQIFLMVIDEAMRLCGPFALRWFLIWLEDYKDDKADRSEGWLWGSLLAAIPLVYTIGHHRLFWLGSMIGYSMRTAILATMHGKMFRLNTSNISTVTTGYVVNVASNDLKRFDLVCQFWPYLILGPMEGLLVFAMISIYLGILPAIAGIGIILIIIPVQALFSKYIGRCRMRTARVSDKRINRTGELISGNLAVKMLGWEDRLLNDVTDIRKQEHQLLKIMGYIRGGNISLPAITQGLVAAGTFITYRFTDGKFNVPDVFFALSLTTLPRLTLANLFVTTVEQASSTWVACRRVDAFLSIPEPQNIHRTELSHPKGTVELNGGTFGWYGQEDKKKANRRTKWLGRNIFKQMPKPAKQVPKLKHMISDMMMSMRPTLRETLSDVSLFVKPGELIGIAGPVGSGKSSLLAALLSDMEDISTSEDVVLAGDVSYCSQIPWIVAGTVKDNITFHHPFDAALYEEVIESCALDVDLDQLPGGDGTQLGERGINISGGQKARIALARAAYSRADIHFLDDPLSAVDPRVGRILFDKCIGPQGMMRHSTRLLVTHQRQFLPLCDRIVLMNDGMIEAVGTWEELSDHHILRFAEYGNDSSQIDLDTGNALETIQEEEPVVASSSRTIARSSLPLNEISKPPEKDDKDESQLIIQEEKETGTISLGIFWEYVLYVGLLPMTLAFTLMLISRACFFTAEWWLGEWASTDDKDQEDLHWVWVLIALTTAGVITSLISSFYMFALLILGSTRLHKDMLRCILRSPLKFFHTNPTGRILNRFSKDLGFQDDELPLVIVDLITNALLVMGTFVLVVIALPYMVIFFAVLAWLFWRIRSRYVVTSREVKRFDGITRSPVFAMLSANIKGLATIRAYGAESVFQERFLEEVNFNGTWWTAFLSMTRWVGFRTDILGACVMFFTVLLAVVLSDNVSAEVLALALTYILALSGIMQWTVRQSAEFENGMTAVERNMEYTKLEQEPPRESEGGGSAPEGWPNRGAIEYASVTASYRPGLDPVLRDLSFVIPGGSSVGIVGRTGSGKSSLLLTLFRLIDVNEGQIRIDSVDASQIGIDVLRRQLAVIPQDPVLFGGTLRSNLDPWNQQSDAKVWEVLKSVSLQSAAGSIGGLSARVIDCGSNFSVGQRQLLCLARALLSDSKILALDEATANVDRTTDAAIQRALHSLIAQNDKTLLIIAHRIDTVMNCDLLLVLDDGQVAEFGSPASLTSKKNGMFASMVAAAQKAMHTPVQES